ncbi:TPA: PAS domain-containing protein [Streptococcus suis]|nr:PAS domain-containing protein [Streptococcus suis]HEM5057210.1 PAS domain-containing protein [Streptococcus suis]HEM5067593.1 PAS domain-containing protein [Streptococcus suis]HEM5164386.1 PAS domain-containing protein [Streptococcus suis]HEM5287531.1 PAS domain-containing protein [Streptococcus suis]
MIFKRTPSQIGRHVELCHPPKILDKVKKIFELLRTKRPGDHVVQVREYGQVCLCGLYKAVRDDQGEFQGVLEYVQNIQPFFEIDSDFHREI